MDEDKKNKLIKLLVIIAVCFVTAFLAFYIALSITLNKFLSPQYHEKQLEKMIQRYEKDFDKFESNLDKHPFFPKNRPISVNLVREKDVYKLIIDLKSLKDNGDGLDIKVKDNTVSVKGGFSEEKENSSQSYNFSQIYYLDGKLSTDKISKNRVEDKYIVTIPYKLEN